MIVACRDLDPTLVFWAALVLVVLALGAFGAGYLTGLREDVP